jgi:hypothetical protein
MNVYLFLRRNKYTFESINYSIDRFLDPGMFEIRPEERIHPNFFRVASRLAATPAGADFDP